MKKGQVRIIKKVLPIIIHQRIADAQNPREVKQVLFTVQDCGGIQTHDQKYPCFLIQVQIEYVPEKWRGD